MNNLMQAYLFGKAERYDVKGCKYLAYPSKYYAEDVGLRNARLNYRQAEQTHLLENVIYNELISRGAKVDVGVVEIEHYDDGSGRSASTKSTSWSILAWASCTSRAC